MTGANYEEAIAKLEIRFGRRNLIVQSHMEEFMKIQPVFSPGGELMIFSDGGVPL